MYGSTLRNPSRRLTIQIFWNSDIAILLNGKYSTFSSYFLMNQHASRTVSLCPDRFPPLSFSPALPMAALSSTAFLHFKDRSARPPRPRSCKEGAEDPCAKNALGTDTCQSPFSASSEKSSHAVVPVSSDAPPFFLTLVRRRYSSNVRLVVKNKSGEEHALTFPICI